MGSNLKNEQTKCYYGGVIFNKILNTICKTMFCEKKSEILHRKFKHEREQSEIFIQKI